MTCEKRVLVSAYACNPYRGSEEGVGWSWTLGIARRHSVVALVSEEHRNDIEHAVREGVTAGADITFRYFVRPNVAVLQRLWPPAFLMSYRVWQKRAYRWARAEHAVRPFDLVHQLTYVGYRVPGHLWKLGAPFVWGPIGGLENTPLRYFPALGIQGACYHAARNIVNSVQRRMHPLPKRAVLAAGNAAIAATSGMARELRRFYSVESTVICEIVPPLDLVPEYRRRQGTEPLRLVWSGLHLSRKALPLLLRALAALPRGLRWELHVLGKGSRTRRWRREARRLGVDSRTIWYGQVTRAEALAAMTQGHAFVTTSLKDLTSTVLLEALALGLPVIAPDHCGFPDVVDRTCGYLVSTRSLTSMVRGIRDAITALHEDEELRLHMAHAARRRAQVFSLDNKMRIVDGMYERKLREVLT